MFNLFTNEEENLGFWLHACGTIVSKPLQEHNPMWENVIYLGVLRTGGWEKILNHLCPKSITNILMGTSFVSTKPFGT